MEKGLAATGTHPYRPLEQRTARAWGNSGKFQPKVGCARGWRAGRHRFRPIGVIAGDAVNLASHLQGQGLLAGQKDRGRHRVPIRETGCVLHHTADGDCPEQSSSRPCIPTTVAAWDNDAHGNRKAEVV